METLIQSLELIIIGIAILQFLFVIKQGIRLFLSKKIESLEKFRAALVMMLMANTLFALLTLPSEFTAYGFAIYIVVSVLLEGNLSEMLRVIKSRD